MPMKMKKIMKEYPNKRNGSSYYQYENTSSHQVNPNSPRYSQVEVGYLEVVNMIPEQKGLL